AATGRTAAIESDRSGHFARQERIPREGCRGSRSAGSRSSRRAAAAVFRGTELRRNGGTHGAQRRRGAKTGGSRPGRIGETPMNLEDLLEAHVAGEKVSVPDDLRSEFECAVAAHEALAYALGETTAPSGEQ